MKLKPRSILIALAAIAVAGAIWIRLHQPEEAKFSDIPGAIYYHGPMRAKGSKAYGNEDGTLASK